MQRLERSWKGWAIHEFSRVVGWGGRSFIRLVEILEANSLLSNPPTPASVDIMESRLSAEVAAVAAASQPPAERDPDAFEPRGRSTHRLGVEGFLVEGVDFLRPKVEPASQPTQPQPKSEPSASRLFGADDLDPAEKATIQEMKANVAEVRKAVSALVADDFFREVRERALRLAFPCTPSTLPLIAAAG